MEGSLSTFIYIAVAILVTLGIASIAFVTVALVGDILGVISSQETTIKERFDEVHEIYDGRVLKGIEGIAFCNMSSKDVVRHPLVQKIVKAYEAYEAKENGVAKHRNRKTGYGNK